MLRTTCCLAAAFVFIPPAVAQSSMPERLPTEAKRLDANAIGALLGNGTTFTYVGADGLATGTSIWSADLQVAYGSFVWAERLKGTWVAKWTIESGLSCLESDLGKMCLEIYGYEDGFFEVNDDGSIHTHSTPKKETALASPLSADEAASLFPALTKWAQKIELSVTSAGESDGVIRLQVTDGGPPAAVDIEAATGLVLGTN